MKLIKEYAFPGHISSLHFIPGEDRVLFTYSRPGVERQVFLSTGCDFDDLQQIVTSSFSGITEVLSHPDKKSMIFAGNQEHQSSLGLVQIRDLLSGELLFQFYDCVAHPHIGISPDGHRLVIVSQGFVYVIYDREIENRLPGYDEIFGIKFLPEGDAFVVAGSDQGSVGLRFFDVGKHRFSSGIPMDMPDDLSDEDWDYYWNEWEKHTIGVCHDSVSGISFSDDGQWLGTSHRHPVVYSCADHDVKLEFGRAGGISVDPDEFYVSRYFWSNPLFVFPAQWDPKLGIHVT